MVLEDIHDPHNAAAALRTAEGFGIGTVYFIFEREKYYNPKRVGKTSSASANKWLDLKVFRSTASCIAALKRSRYRIYATTVDSAASSIFDCRFRGKVALLFGNEHRGLSARALRSSDETLTIPMRGMVQSLNISATAAICIFEVSRQRRLIAQHGFLKTPVKPTVRSGK